jgi:hypothetical protein
VFHVSLIQAFLTGKDLLGRLCPPPPPLELKDGLEYKVERILSHCDRKVRTKGKRTVIRTDYLVSWVGFGPEHNSYEPEENLKNAQEAIQEYWDVTAKRSVGEKRRRRADVSSRNQPRVVSALTQVSKVSKVLKKRKQKPRPNKKLVEVLQREKV